MDLSSLTGFVPMIEASVSPTVVDSIVQARTSLASFVGVSIPAADIATAASVDAKLVFGLANVGIAHFAAGTPTPAKKAS